MIARARRLAASITGVALAFVAACDAGAGSGASRAGGTPPVAVENVGLVDAPSFLALMPDAPERVVHGGLRRVEFHVDVHGVPTSLVYEERVTADGAGRYAIETVSVAAPSMTVPQREVFDELQRARQGFFFKYRDLRVRDVELFLANYAVDVVADAAVVAGVECVELEITPFRGPRRSYRLAVEARTGLVLRAVERDAEGTVVAASTFLEFTREPVLAGVEYHVESVSGVPIPDAQMPSHFAPARPQIVPEGYREVSGEVLTLAGDTYVRRVYGDGLENVFFLQRQQPAAPGPISAESANVVVRIAEMGAFRIAEAERGRGNFFVVGKISEADVLSILRSAL